ncbi:MAG: hypothetical protein C0392_08635 [Syntrophus sp. (in: bacteria)]|nr:hypothetical protein [Syntrophus sp. (in: bacteria)]
MAMHLYFFLEPIMKIRRSHMLFALPRHWSSRDWILLCVLAAAGIILLWAGLSTRSLWGSEGRWAVVAREMLRSGNYFLPTINGQVYFDKPLLSYWLIVPFAWIKGGVTEAIARMPSALSGLGAVLLIFCMGKRLFGTRTGLLSGALFLTSVMFVLWARTASAEILNLLSIWCIIWFFMAGGIEGRLKYLIALYSIGAVAAFLKGPVAPAAAFSVMGFYSLVRAVLRFRSGRPEWGAAKDAILSHFRWIISWNGLVSILAAILLFSLLLLMPVIATGSWQSIELMWRENVLRFVKPFDHVEPPYAYLKHALVFFLPWTFLFLAALWEARKWPSRWSHRSVLIVGIAIFLFFTASGSRRSYYILPLVPALALITGKALSDWLGRVSSTGPDIMRLALFATAAIPGLAGIALLYACCAVQMPYSPSQFIVSAVAIAGSGAVLFLVSTRQRIKGLITLFVLIFILEVWFFTGGMAAMEGMRTSRSFYREAAARLAGIDDNRIALFQSGDSSLIFYLNRGAIKSLYTLNEAEKFQTEYPDGIIISEMKNIEELRKHISFKNAVIILAQEREQYGNNDNIPVIMRFQGK